MGQDQRELSTQSHLKGVPLQHWQAATPNPEQNDDFQLNGTEFRKTFVAQICLALAFGPWTLWKHYALLCYSLRKDRETLG